MEYVNVQNESLTQLIVLDYEILTAQLTNGGAYDCGNVFLDDY